MSSLGRAFSSLRYRDFALFWTAAVISNTGSWMQSITVPFVIFDLTGSTTWLGVSAAFAFLPPFLVGPLAGAVADRYPRRMVLLVTQTIQMIAAFGLWAVWVGGEATVASILGILLLSSIASGINIPSWQAFVPSLVPDEALINAVRLNSMQFTVARAIGPAIAGLVLSRFGAGTTFMANAVTFFFVIAALLAVSPRPGPVRPVQASFVKEFREGVGYVRRHAGALQCIFTAAAVALFAQSLVQLTPAITEDQFSAGDTGYGLLVSAYGVGSIVASLAIAMHADRFRRSTTTLVSLTGAGLGAMVLGLAPVLAVGLIGLFIVGVGQTLSSITQNTAVQLQVSDRYRGRVLSLYLMMLFIGIPLGTFLLGLVAERVGIHAASIVAGVCLVGYCLVGVFAFDGMRVLDSDLDPTLSAEQEAETSADLAATEAVAP